MDGEQGAARPNQRQAIGDAVLAVVCLAVALAIHVSGIDAVPENRSPDALSVAFTVAAVAPLAVRRWAPLQVLILCFPGIYALILGRYGVGAAPIGTIIGFYTAIAWDSRRNARWAVVTVIAGVAGALVLRPVDLGVEGAIANAAVLIGGWVIGTGTRQRREHAAAQTAAAQLQVALERERADLASDRAQLATAQERLRISRELHDVLGHAFSVMVVQAGVAERLLDTDPERARTALQQVSATGRASLSDLRGLVQVLRTSDESEVIGAAPGLADVPALAGRVRAAGLDVQLQLDLPAPQPNPGVELAAYRIIQESLTNCLKHAQATVARVCVTSAPGHLEIEVRDDGRGSAGPGTTSGQGLAGLRERVAIYDGQFEAGPWPGGGYRVWARLP